MRMSVVYVQELCTRKRDDSRHFVIMQLPWSSVKEWATCWKCAVAP